MSSLTAPNPLADFLRQAKELTEIRDVSGKVIGFFAPVSTENTHLFAKADTQADMGSGGQSSGKCYTTTEVFERLLPLTTDEKMRTYLQKKIAVLAERDACATP
jgi:hypothetical protein